MTAALQTAISVPGWSLYNDAVTATTNDSDGHTVDKDGHSNDGRPQTMTITATIMTLDLNVSCGVNT